MYSGSLMYDHPHHVNTSPLLSFVYFTPLIQPDLSVLQGWSHERKERRGEGSGREGGRGREEGRGREGKGVDGRGEVGKGRGGEGRGRGHGERREGKGRMGRTEGKYVKGREVKEGNVWGERGRRGNERSYNMHFDVASRHN